MNLNPIEGMFVVAIFVVFIVGCVLIIDIIHERIQKWVRRRRGYLKGSHPPQQNWWK